ncbi:MAG: phage virion morphogenesis protein [Thiohalomonadaceae bacterium]
MDDLSAIDGWIGAFVERLGAAERRKLARRLAIGLRARQARRIAEQRNPDGSKFEPRKPRKLGDKAGRIKRTAAMFIKLRQARHMLVESGADGASVGFTGVAAVIARIHQEGLLNKLGPNGPLYQYPSRRLLGWTDEDEDWVMEQVLNHLRG